MTKILVRCLLLSSAFLTFTGCKLAVIVPSGGDVTSASNTRNCTGGSLCEHNITDSTFDESFTAVARPGYVFSKWNTGARFFCGDSTNPTCTISNVGTAGNVFIEAVIATGQFFYVMPLFEFVGIDTDGDGVKDHVDTDDDNDGVLDIEDNCPLVGPNYDGFGCPSQPITDTVIAGGKLWAQLDLFINLSWNQINAICPLGVCISRGVLNGHDMTGWTWATSDDLVTLFRAHIDPEYYYYGGRVSYFDRGPLEVGMFADSWRAVCGPGYLAGILATEEPTNPNRARVATYSYQPADLSDTRLDNDVSIEWYDDRAVMDKWTPTSCGGAWFYRSL